MDANDAQTMLGFSLGVGLVVFNQILSFLIGLVIGGFEVGSLRRTVEIDVGSAWMESFLERLRERADEIGFVGTADSWVCEQSGATVGDLESMTHEKTHKRLTVSRDGTSAGSRVQLTLEYLDPILGDTGESAYRDAVLAYLSQATDTMPEIANRSYLAFTALWGGVLTLAAALGMPALGFSDPVTATLVFVNAFVHGGAAIISLIPILRQSGRITGQRDAVGAIALSAAAVVLVAIRYLNGG